MPPNSLELVHTYFFTFEIYAYLSCLCILVTMDCISQFHTIVMLLRLPMVANFILGEENQILFYYFNEIFQIIELTQMIDFLVSIDLIIRIQVLSVISSFKARSSACIK